MAKKVTDERLKDLFDLLTDVLYQQLSEQSEEIAFDKDGNRVITGKKVYTASPALIAQALKLLNDNNIKCEIETHDKGSKIKELIEAKRNKRLISAGEADEEDII